MLTNIFFTKILFAVEILVAEFLFTFRLKKRRLYALRFAACVVALLAAAALFPVPVNNAWYTSFMFFVLFAVTVPMLEFCYSERWINMLFCAIASYTIQHFSYQCATLLLTLVSFGSNPIIGMYGNSAVDIMAFDKLSVLYMLIYLLCFVGSYWAFFAVFGGRIRKGADMRVKSASLLFLIGAGLLTDIIINAFAVYADNGFSSIVCVCVLNMLCCVLLLYAQFSLVYSKELQNDMETVNRLYREEKKQYALLKESMDLINMKCHDMRHQIREIGENQKLSGELISEMEKTISIYDSVVKTGNETLDVILTEKSLKARGNGITLSCIADGAALGFLSECELFSLIGNALDNALEAAMSVDEPEKRIVGFKLYATGELVTVNVQNSFGGAVRFGDDGLPVTTKADKNYHGYGIKSMKYITDKYGGDIFVEVSGDVFKLNILLPSLKSGS